MKIKKFEANKPFWSEEPEIMKNFYIMLREVWGNELNPVNFDYSEFASTYRVTFTFKRILDERTYEIYNQFFNLIRKGTGWSFQWGTSGFNVTLILNVKNDEFLKELELIYNARKYNL